MIIKWNEYVINNEDEIFANRTDIENWIDDKNCARLKSTLEEQSLRWWWKESRFMISDSELFVSISNIDSLYYYAIIK